MKPKRVKFKTVKTIDGFTPYRCETIEGWQITPTLYLHLNWRNWEVINSKGLRFIEFKLSANQFPKAKVLKVLEIYGILELDWNIDSDQARKSIMCEKHRERGIALRHFAELDPSEWYLAGINQEVENGIEAK